MERLILGFSAVLFLLSSPISSASNCLCPSVWQPVCASNGITYSNLCQFQCVQAEQPGLTVVTQHACNPKLTVKNKGSEQHEAFCMCTMDYKPVCGSDGKTYGNPCTFDCAKASNQNLLLSSYGECTATLKASAAHLVADVPEVKPVERLEPTRCFCTREYSPVCGSNKVTYSNLCEFRCALDSTKGLTLLSEGHCEEEPA